MEPSSTEGEIVITARIPVLAAAIAAAAAIGLWLGMRRRERPLPAVFLYLTFVLPFAAGGFHTWIAMITNAVLLGNLVFLVRRNRGFRFVYNLNSLAVLLVTLAYCISPLWAADKGMAAFAPVRYLPLLLLSLTLMQYRPEETEAAVKLVPFTGAVMTVISCLLLLLPQMDRYLTVGGRLSGFLQYPNIFAIFLLAGIILNNTKPARSRPDPVIDAVLVAGIVLSGSRTGFLLLAAAVIGLAILKKRKKLLLSLGLSLCAALLLAFAAAGLDLLPNADRFLSMFREPQSLMTRLLYYKDALPVIAAHPFGLGYLGYRTMQGTFQTGAYSVTFVHNGLLQLLLDVGWIPGLVMAAALGKTLFSRRTAPGKRLLLGILLAHCMMEFDLQFFLFWVLLLSVLDFDTGKVLLLRKGKVPGLCACAVALALCLWLGSGDLLYNLGYNQLCRSVTPFHSDNLCASLLSLSDPAELDALADQILVLNPDNSIAWGAKANAAFSQGQIASMMEYKEAAIRCSRYSTAEYCDYFEKLYIAMQIYAQSGDSGSAAVCAEKLRAIPEWMAAVSESTDPLALLAGVDSTLELPQEYASILEQLG